MLSPVSTALAFAAFPAAYRMILPASVAGGVQSNSNVSPAPTAVTLDPDKVCSMYCSTGFALQGTSRVFAPAQRTCVVASAAVSRPARVFELLARRAVSWNPHLRWVGSVTVTLMRCFTPGVYVVPPASIATLPLPRLGPAPVWQPDSAQVDSPGTPDLPGSGPAACA